MEPLQAMSRFLYLIGALLIPVAWIGVVLLKRRWDRTYEGTVPEASPEEIVGELEREFAPSRQTIVRTQTEYLPFLFECIRENIDSGFEDAQVISLLHRIGFQKPGREWGAVFPVTAGDWRGDLQLRWTRDACDRIVLKFQAAPVVIRALRSYRKKIPGAVMEVC